MGRKNKLKRFADVATFPNVYEVDPAQESFLTNQEGSSSDLRGNWAAGHFQNTHPVILELACGKGDYTVALARDHPENNYIGVDIKGARGCGRVHAPPWRPGWAM
jgi:tRNA (guanine-N7-)-methyltransferase